MGYRILAAVLAALALMGGGYRWGVSATNNKHAAEQLKTEKKTITDLRAEVARGDAAVTALQGDRATLLNSYMNLQEAFNASLKRHPVVVRRSGAPVGAPSMAATQPGPGEPADAQACADSAPVDGTELVLSNNAVWVWNSALVGADRPAGACGLAGESEEACAAESGATLEDAWRNHTINAQLCAEDRLNHQRLIDFIKNKEKRE